MNKQEQEEKMISLEKKHINLSIGVAISVILFLILMSYNFATWKSDIQNEQKEINERIDHLSDKYVAIVDDIKIMDEKANGRDIQLTEIKTKLANIELLLLEIKQDIKEK